MKAVLLALTTGLSVAGGVVLYQDAVERSADSAAYTQGALISDAAFFESEWGTSSWEEALAAVVASSRDRDNLTLDGTTITWTAGDHCYVIELPEPTSIPNPVRCE